MRPDRSIFYVGKGKGGRINDHFTPSKMSNGSRKANTISKYGKELIVREIISYHEDEEDAYLTEEYLIKYYGVLAEGGILSNVSKGREDYPESVVGYVAKNVVSLPNKYTEQQILNCYDLYYSQYKNIRQIEDITGIPSNYLYPVIAGKKCKGLYEKHSIDSLAKKYDQKLKEKLYLNRLYSDEGLIKVLDYYFKGNLSIDNIEELTGISGNYIRSICQGSKRSYLFDQYKQKNPNSKRTTVKSTFELQKMVEAALISGLSVAQVMVKCGAPKTSVYRWAKGIGISFPKRTPIPLSTINIIYEQYFIQGFSPEEITKGTSVNTKYVKALIKGSKRARTLHNFLKDNGIKQ
tara:strand:- start:363 stop:1412 length:1050 start_codon:yes stop_codon:yes gene_type:complete